MQKSVRLNGSVYYYDYRNHQVLGTIVNPPKLEIYGGELEATVTPTTNPRQTQSIAFKKGEYPD